MGERSTSGAEGVVRHVVVVTRMGIDSNAAMTVEEVVLGPFRRIERAEARAATVRRLAAKYDDDYATLHVTVEPLRGGSTSAQEAMDLLYGGVE